jgi:acetoin:2,6-dichlorophenolindophenol oxidoreductase subunit beta|tara:strand:+ start:2398 stop:3462 length:1065 start_codon:yes stop_codon:yes gene_type:complete
MQNKKKTFTFAEAINEGLQYCMKKDKNLLCFGLGVTDPKGVFGTTLNLEKNFGRNRVFDIPCSENAVTGVAIGASLNGTRSVVTHQRLDFFLLAMDQLVNSAAKWHYMFGSQKSVPITIRLIIGRGWGQGPTHSQNLQSLFNHIPGLKIVAPTFAEDAKSLLISSIQDPNPVIFLEHRWLHGISSKSKKKNKILKLGKAKKCINGKDFTIISFSYLTLEAISAANFLKKKYNISCEVIDLRTIKPLDWNCLYKSVEKTGRVLVLDTGHENGSIAGEIVAKIAMEKFNKLKSKPIRLAMPDFPEPTSHALTKNFYIKSQDIVKKILENLKIKKIKLPNLNNKKKDQQEDWFKGPF